MKGKRNQKGATTILKYDYNLCILTPQNELIFYLILIKFVYNFRS